MTGLRCGHCLKTSPAFDTTFALWPYAFPISTLVHQFKYQHRLAVGRFFSDALLAGPRPAGDVILPVPLSAEHLRERGFNQALELARLLSKHLGIPLDIDSLHRTGHRPAQASLPWKERHKNIRHAFECRADFSGKTVILVDDVMTTGATLNEVASTLKKHGAAKVINWVVARALKE